MSASRELQNALAAHNIHVKKLLGSGSFSEVYAGSVIAKEQRVPAAVKCYTTKFTNLTQTQIVEVARTEVAVSSKLKHPHIIETYQFVCSPDVVCVCLELAAGDVFDKIVPSVGVVVSDAIRMLHQLCDALAYMHDEAHLVHMDIKAENILLDERGNVKLADFDAAVPNGTKVQTPRGTRAYHPPELVAERSDGYVLQPAVDIWGVGILAYLLLNGNYPWEEASQTDPKYSDFCTWYSTATSGCPTKNNNKVASGVNAFWKKLSIPWREFFDGTLLVSDPTARASAAVLRDLLGPDFEDRVSNSRKGATRRNSTGNLSLSGMKRGTSGGTRTVSGGVRTASGGMRTSSGVRRLPSIFSIFSRRESRPVGQEAVAGRTPSTSSRRSRGFFSRLFSRFFRRKKKAPVDTIAETSLLGTTVEE